MVRPPFCDSKMSVIKGSTWSVEKEENVKKILKYADKNNGNGKSTTSVAKKSAGGKRCGKSCSRLRWRNCLSTGQMQQSFTPQEEELIIRLHATIGSRWSIIAQQLPGRTDIDVKNYWNTKLKKKLSEMGIDPVTHKPFSQIFADYGSIGGGLITIPKPPARLGPLTRDFKNINNNNNNPALLISSKPPQTDKSSSPEVVEPAQDHNNHSIDLLTQLQAITLVKVASSSGPTQFFCTQCSSVYLPSTAPPSSSSSSLAANQEGPAQSFSWHDFLLEDPYLVMENNQELLKQDDGELAGTDFTREKLSSMVECDIIVDHPENNNGLKDDDSKSSGDSTSSSSFIKKMLEGENDMFLEFPGILDETFYYY